MKRFLLTACLLFVPAVAAAQDEPKPFVAPNETRYLYEICSKPIQFEYKGAKHFGYPVIRWAQSKGEIRAIGIGGRVAFQFVSPDGDAHVHLPFPCSGGLMSVNPLPLYVADKGDYAGWVFVKPPFAGIKVVPPAPRKLPELETRPAPPNPPQVLRTYYKAIQR